MILPLRKAYSQVLNSCCHLKNFYFNPQPKIYFLLIFREGGRERDIDWLPPICTLTGGQTHTLGMCPAQGRTHHLLVHGMTLQPTEQPGQGCMKKMGVLLGSVETGEHAFVMAEIVMNDLIILQPWNWDFARILKETPGAKLIHLLAKTG